jgi:uncharacterized membrane protein
VGRSKHTMSPILAHSHDQKKQTLYLSRLDAAAPRSIPYGRASFQVAAMTFLTSGQMRALRWIAVASASVSIMSAVVAMYWFLRMKRKFRHLYGLLPAHPTNAWLTTRSKLDHEADWL